MMGMGTYAKLMPSMIKYADEVGEKRQKNAEERDRAQGTYPINDPVEALENNKMAARAERAVKVYFPYLEWHDYREGGFGGLPDLGPIIDVKGTMWPGPKPTLKCKIDRYKEGDGLGLNPDWAYVLAAGEHHPYWWIVGWAWGRELLLGEPRDGGKSFWLYPKQLHPIYLLQQFMKKLMGIK